MMLTSTSIPTPIRKYGMKRALPTNSIRVMSGLVLGTRRLMTNPARKAPSSPSSPTSLASDALRKTRARMKMYCMTLSENRRRNHLPMRGKKKMTNAP